MAKARNLVELSKNMEGVPIESTLPAERKPSLPAVAVSSELLERIAEVQGNLESVEDFRLPRCQMTAEGLVLIEGEKPILELTGVIIHTKKTNVYYDKPYNPSDISPPTCYSLDGVKPEDLPPSDEYMKQHETCKGCPKAEYGTNSMKSGKACRNLKPVFLLLGDEAIMPRQLTVAPSSLKAANQYLLDLTERGMSYRKVKTRVTLFKKQSRDTYLSMKFEFAGKLNEQEIANAAHLRNTWMNVMNNQSVDLPEFSDEQSAARATSVQADTSFNPEELERGKY